jgi:hypothetical protein
MLCTYVALEKEWPPIMIGDHFFHRGPYIIDNLYMTNIYAYVIICLQLSQENEIAKCFLSLFFPSQQFVAEEILSENQIQMNKTNTVLLTAEYQMIFDEWSGEQ